MWTYPKSALTPISCVQTVAHSIKNTKLWECKNLMQVSFKWLIEPHEIGVWHLQRAKTILYSWDGKSKKLDPPTTPISSVPSIYIYISSYLINFHLWFKYESKQRTTRPTWPTLSTGPLDSSCQVTGIMKSLPTRGWKEVSLKIWEMTSARRCHLSWAVSGQFLYQTEVFQSCQAASAAPPMMAGLCCTWKTQVRSLSSWGTSLLCI